MPSMDSCIWNDFRAGNSRPTHRAELTHPRSFAETSGLPEAGMHAPSPSNTITAHSPKGHTELPGKPIPKPSILDGFEYVGAFNRVRRWRSLDRERIFTWDSLHGEVEVFNRRGRHLGVLDALNGRWIKPAVRGRKIDV
jgi:putative cytotoxic protein